MCVAVAGLVWRAVCSKWTKSDTILPPRGRDACVWYVCNVLVRSWARRVCFSTGEVCAMPASTSSKHRMQRVIATDGSTEPLTGVCVFFLRTNTSKPVTTANMVEVSIWNRVWRQKFILIVWNSGLIFASWLLLRCFMTVHAVGTVLWSVGCPWWADHTAGGGRVPQPCDGACSIQWAEVGSANTRSYWWLHATDTVLHSLSKQWVTPEWGSVNVLEVAIIHWSQNLLELDNGIPLQCLLVELQSLLQ